MADRDTIIQTVAGLALSTAIGLAAGLLAGLLLDPNDYPRDRPAPMLAVYATCPVGSP